MNTIQLVRHNDWLRRLAASAVAVAVAFGPLQASAQRAVEFGSTQDSTAPNASASATAAIDPGMLERAQKKLRDAVAIADHFVPEASAAGLGDGWRMTMITNLMKGSQANFANVASAQTLSEARLAAIEVAAAGFTSGERSKTLGVVTGDLTFSPMTPCRLIDTTQTGGGGPFTAGEVRTYFYTSNYGSSGCSTTFAGVDAFRPAAMAVNINVLALSSSFANAGYLAAYPDGGAPNTAWMTYKFGDVIANAGIMPINQGNGNYKIFVQFGTHIKVDVFGVFTAPEATALDCVDTTPVTSVINSGPFNGGVYFAFATAATCATGYASVALRCTVNNGLASASQANTGVCAGNAFGNNSYTLGAVRTCCRTPGR